MKHPGIVSLVTLAVSAALSGCGGGGGGDKAVTSMTATAIDGYLQNALVWLDVNGDGLPDTTNEPNARTGTDGKATLDVSAVTNPGQYRLLVKAIANETVDLERGTVTRDYTMSAPAGVSVVTPLSTLVDLKMQQDPSLTRAAATSAVASDLGVDNVGLLGDFIASNQTTLQVYAVNLTDTLPETLPDDPTALIEKTTAVGQALQAYLSEHPLDDTTDPDTINVTTDSQGNAVTIVDRDRDGVADSEDAFPDNAKEWADTDGDKVGDNSDAFPTDATESVDTDGDKVGDNSDAFPADAKEWADTDGDKVGDNSDTFPTDATEWVDTDGDKVGDNKDQLPNDPLRWRADEITVTDKIHDEIEPFTKEVLHLHLVETKTKSRFIDGHKTVHVEGTNTYWTGDAATGSAEQLNGAPLVYSQYTTDKTVLADNTYTRTSHWKKDVNKDGVFNYHGQDLQIGTETDTASDYWEYMDEDSGTAEVGSPVNAGRYYDGSDLAAMVKAGDLSTVDLVQHWTVTLENDEPIYEHFEEVAAPKNVDAPQTPVASNWFDIVTHQPDPSLDLKGYAQTTTTTTDNGCKTVTEEDDWDHDDSINTVLSHVTCDDGSTVDGFKKPIWASPKDDLFEEYADYNWYQDFERSSYWYELTVSHSVKDGQAITKSSGKRYVLDETNNVKLTNTENPDGLLFQEWTGEHIEVSPTESTEYATWKHYHLDGYPFTANSDDIGQDVKIYFTDSNGFVTGHRFAEWGSQNVTDLPDKIATLRQQGVTVDQINASNLPGLSNYDGKLLTDSWRYASDGTPRTWYWLTNMASITGDNTWSTWNIVPIQLVNNGLAGAGLNNWLINEAAGSLIMLQPLSDTPWDWYNAYNQIKIGADTVDSLNGSFTTWAGDFYLSQTAAENAKQFK